MGSARLLNQPISYWSRLIPSPRRYRGVPTFVDRPEGLAPILACLSKFLQAPVISLVMYVLFVMWCNSNHPYRSRRQRHQQQVIAREDEFDTCPSSSTGYPAGSLIWRGFRCPGAGECVVFLPVSCGGFWVAYVFLGAPLSVYRCIPRGCRCSQLRRWRWTGTAVARLLLGSAVKTCSGS